MNDSTPITCAIQNGKSGKPLTLARVDCDSLYLWCKLCHVEHRFSRESLNLIWDELAQQHAHKQQDEVLY